VCKIRAPSFAHLQAMDFLSRALDEGGAEFPGIARGDVATSPGWKQFAVTPVPSSRRASSVVAYSPLFACDDCTFVDQFIARRLQA
jgi:hypothetical protein